MTVSVNPTGLGVGKYTGIIEVSTDIGGTRNDPHRTGRRRIGGESRIFVVLLFPGGQVPAAGNASMTSLGAPLTFSVAAVTTDGGNWLSVSSSSEETPATLSVMVNPTSLVQGTYSGTITVTVQGGGSAAVEVYLTIGAAGDLILSTYHLEYVGDRSGTPPIPYTIGVTSATAVPRSYTLNLDPGTIPSDHISVSRASGATPNLETVTVDPSNLTPGDYHATVSFVSNNRNYDVPVSLTVTGLPARIEASPTFFDLVTSSSSQPIQKILSIRNQGGGNPQTCSLTITSGASWLSVTAGPDVVNSRAGLLQTVTIDPRGLAPGPHVGNIRVTMGDQSQDVPVTVAIADTRSFIGIQFTGVQFLAREGEGLSLTQDVGVTNLGGGNLNFTAAVQPGANWLSVTQAADHITLAVNTSGLTAGVYYGLVDLTDATASNSPQEIMVALNVVPASSTPIPIPKPDGLSFVMSANGPAPGSQKITVFTSSSSPVAFTSAVETNDGGSWLSISPSSGQTSTLSPGVVTVTINPSGLTSGIYRGGVSFSTAPGVVSTTTITLVVTTSQSATAREELDSKGIAVCSPSQLVPVFSGLVDGFTTWVGQPMPITVHLLDDCGQSVSNASVMLRFSAGDPQALSLPCTDASNGIYSGTWIPTTPITELNVWAESAAGDLSGTSEVNGSAAPNVSAPILSVNGIRNNLDQGLPSLLSPGTVVAIYGSNLAAASTPSQTLPLPLNLAGTRVLVGGIPAPLFYVSPTQVNAQVPVELKPGRSYPVVISVKGMLTVPESIPLVVAKPAIAAYADSTVIAQHADFSLVTEKSPAKPGETVIVYLTGMGPTDILVPSGFGAPDTEPFARVTIAPNLSVDGQSAAISFAGLTPGTAGLYQINFTVPQNVSAGGVKLIVTQDGQESNTVILPVSGGQ